ncbi:hypothetical protein ACSV9I_19540 [Rhizobium sp. G187]|uniref:hypothetical protein n=1 Tax=unclassified Rhizobium TaxID=2613769 RepID=UPI0006B8F70F|nr:hypothetical protein [Rhizobium sp. AAP43]KPF44457.1 hypothetical protein IP76_11070 [Rhizobium sp. AAP43]
MTVATNALLTAMIGATSLLDLGIDDFDPPVGEITANEVLRDHAPATWLDAVSVDDRCRAGQTLPPRAPAPCDEAGLYPGFLRIAD